MDLEKKNNQQEPVEETQYTGCDEELSQEVTDEEYEEVMGEIYQEYPENNSSLKGIIAHLKDQAVCKILFIFAAIGFIFPFVSEYMGKEPAFFLNGIDLFKKHMLVQYFGMDEIGKSWLMIAAFAVIVLGFILTVLLRRELRNIAGFVCSAVSGACMGVYAYMLPIIYNESVQRSLVKLSEIYTQQYRSEISSYYESMGMPIDSATLETIKVDLTNVADRQALGIQFPEFKAAPSTGFWFVVAILAVLAIYFIVQIVIDSKRRANAVMAFYEEAATEYYEDDEDASEENQHEVETIYAPNQQPRDKSEETTEE